MKLRPLSVPPPEALYEYSVKQFGTQKQVFRANFILQKSSSNEKTREGCESVTVSGLALSEVSKSWRAEGVGARRFSYARDSDLFSVPFFLRHP